MSRWEGGHQGAGGDLTECQTRGLGFVGKPNEPRVDPAFAQGVGLLQGGEVEEVNRDLGTGGPEGGDAGGGQGMEEAPDVREIERGMLDGRAGPCGAQRGLASFQDGHGFRKERLSRGREHHPVGLPHQEAVAHLVLQLPYLSAERGLRHPEPSGGPAESAILGDRNEVPEVSEFHGARDHTGSAWAGERGSIGRGNPAWVIGVSERLDRRSDHELERTMGGADGADEAVRGSGTSVVGAASGRDLAGGGLPATELFPYVEIAGAVRRALAANPGAALQYGETEGTRTSGIGWPRGMPVRAGR